MLELSACRISSHLRRPACTAHASSPLPAMSALPRRLLGNTGLQVSVLGFGASPLGGVFEVGTIRQGPCVPCMDESPVRLGSSIDIAA